MNNEFQQGMSSLLENTNASKNFSKAKTLEEKYEIAKPFFREIDFDTFKKEFNKCKYELSIDQLESVAGGAELPPKVRDYLNKISAVAGMVAAFLPGLIPGVSTSKLGKAIIDAVSSSTMTLTTAESYESILEGVSDGVFQGLESGEVITEDQKNKLKNAIKVFAGIF